MSEVISKELLSEVLNINNKVSWYFEIRGNTLFWDGDYNLNGSINIHELSYKVKDYMENNFIHDFPINETALDYIGICNKYYNKNKDTK